MRKLAAVVVLILLSLGTTASEPLLPWRNYEFREIGSLAALPASIQEKLGTHIAGIGGVAERDRPFNATDVVVGSHPMRRFVVAGQSGNTWLVALEHGGIAYYIEVYLFTDGASPQRWTLPISRPPSLQTLLQKLPATGAGES